MMAMYCIHMITNNSKKDYVGNDDKRTNKLDMSPGKSPLEICS